jgi:Xaa-Pro aminopeptidase
LSPNSDTDRCDRLVAELARAQIDLLLVTELSNLRYVTGHSGAHGHPTGLALIGPQLRRVVIEARHARQAKKEISPSFEQILAAQDLVSSMPDLLPAGVVRLGFDDTHTSVSEHAMLHELLRKDVTLVPASGLVESLRTIKEPAEVEAMVGAAQIADEAFKIVIDGGLRGRTERDISLALQIEMHRRGADEPSFPPIVAAGSHSVYPHPPPSDTVIAEGDLVLIDWGALYQGYCSDCTRTVAVGHIDEHAQECYELVQKAQFAGLQAVKPGGNARQIDASVRAVFIAAGYADAETFDYGLGHGVGLEIHEAPTMSRRASDVLAESTTVTVEPGLYLPGRFGIRIEDTVVVRAGANQILTSLSKELQTVD